MTQGILNYTDSTDVCRTIWSLLSTTERQGAVHDFSLDCRVVSIEISAARSFSIFGLAVITPECSGCAGRRINICNGAAHNVSGGY